MKHKIMKLLSCLFFSLFLISSTFSQVTVAGSSGADGEYASLPLAFTAINSNTQDNKNLTITITGVANQGASSAILNAQAWTSLTIMPGVGGGTISGNPANPLIDLNGADNVTIDGRVGGAGPIALTITNISTGAANTSTIRFTAGATSNAVKYCNILGSQKSATGGVILFSTTGGNSSNQISNNKISTAAATATLGSRPYNCIYSAGATGNPNSNNTISNNEIYDSRNNASTSCGVKLESYNTAWTISGNSFYDTQTTNGGNYYPILIGSVDGMSLPNQKPTGTFDIQVLDNYIGGSQPLCGGSALANSGNTYGSFYGIVLNADSGTKNLIQNNKIKNINYSKLGLIGGYFSNIATYSGDVDIKKNQIGDQNSNGSIIVESNSFGGYVFGINIASSGTVNCTDNQIGSITFGTSSSSVGGIIFWGINNCSVGGTITISNNILGSTSQVGSITGTNILNTGKVQDLIAIKISGTGTNTTTNNTIANLVNATVNSTYGQTVGILSTAGTNTINGNVIHDLSNASGITSSSAVVGIDAGGTTATVMSNSVYNLIETNSNFAGTIKGVNFSATSGVSLSNNEVYNLSIPNINNASAASIYGLNISQTISNPINSNFIHDFSVNAASTGGSFYGIYFSNSSNTYSNNIISFMPTTATTLYGMYDAGGWWYTNNIYFNTIYMGGSTVAVNLSYCMYSHSDAVAGYDIRNVRSNIFHNERNNTSGSIANYAIYCDNSALYKYGTSQFTLISDNNDYVANGTGSAFGYFGALKQDLNAWQNATLQDFASVSVDPGFIAPGSTASSYTPTTNPLVGIAAGGVTKDYNDINTRPLNIGNVVPTMGAIEIVLDLPVKVYAMPANTLVGTYATLGGAFAKFNDGTHKSGVACPAGTFDIRISNSTSEPASAVLYQSGYNGVSAYNAIHVFPTKADLTLGSNLGTPMILLDGADNITIDGRINGTGSNKALTLINRNNADSAATVLFRNGACNNAVEYAIIKNAGGRKSYLDKAGQLGAVVFLGTSDEVGNSNNSILNNTFTNAGISGRPASAIYSNGEGVGKENSNILIKNNDFADVMNITNSSLGTNIFVQDYNKNWKIQANNFYETSSLSTSNGYGESIYPVLVGSVGFFGTPSSCIGTSNISIMDNYFGGSAPACGGNAYTKSPNELNRYAAITIGITSGNKATVQNNIIKNFSWSNGVNWYEVQPWAGIVVADGDVNIGDSIPNIIGDSVGTNSIYVKPATRSFSPNEPQMAIGTVAGVVLGGSGKVVCNNNIIGSINIDAEKDTTYAANFIGIQSQSDGTVEIKGNMIGSRTTANSILCMSTSTLARQNMVGISVTGSGQGTTSANCIANLKNSSTNPTSGSIMGIVSKATTNNITDNTIRDVSISNGNTSVNDSASVVGILANKNASVLGNTISNLKNLSTNFAGNVYGICMTNGTALDTISRNTISALSLPNVAGATTGSLIGIGVDNGKKHTCEVSSNFVHTFDVNSSSTATKLYGISTKSGISNVYNNIVYLAPNSATTIHGIYDAGQDSCDVNILNNTLYVGGSTGTGVTNKSYALYSNAATNARTIKNNILFNERSTSGGSSLHYTIFCNYSTNAKLSSNNNDLFANGQGAVLGYFGADKTGMFEWQSASLMDYNSVSLDPQFASVGTDPKGFAVGTDLLMGESGLSKVVADYFGTSRAVVPTMGAIEYKRKDIPTNTSIGSDEQLNLSYNPFQILITNNTKEQGLIQITSISGIQVFESTFAADGVSTIPTNFLNPSCYIVNIKTSKIARSMKMVK
jgi:hypothetical protein